MAIFVDPRNQTFLYTMHMESLRLAPERSDLIGTPLECQWHTWGCKDCSSSFSVLDDQAHSIKYDAFFVVSFRSVTDRSLMMRLSLVPSGVLTESVGIAMLDLGTFSQEEAFRAQVVDFLAGADVVATAKLFTASQPRWMVDAPVVQQAEGSFVDHTADAQAGYIRCYMAGQPLSDPSLQESMPEEKSVARELKQHQQEKPLRRRPPVGKDDKVVDSSWRGDDNTFVRATASSGTKEGRSSRARGATGASDVGSVPSGTSSEGGFLGRLSTMMGCAQEHLKLVRQVQAACVPEALVCECRSSRDAWEPETREPAPPRTMASIPEEPLDMVFRPPCVAAAVARHALNGDEAKQVL